MRKLVLAVAVIAMGGCASRSLPDAAEAHAPEPPPIAPYAGCVLDLDAPMAIHLDAPVFTECPDGEVACPVPVFCRGFGDRYWSADTMEISDNQEGQDFELDLVGEPGAHGPGSVSFNMAGYVCVDARTSPTSSYRYDSDGRWHVTFAMQCHNETKPVFMVEGAASGPLQNTN